MTEIKPDLNCLKCGAGIVVVLGNYVDDDGDVYCLDCYRAMYMVGQTFESTLEERVVKYVLDKLPKAFAEHFEAEHRIHNCDSCRVIKIWINALLKQFKLILGEK